MVFPIAEIAHVAIPFLELVGTEAFASTFFVFPFVAVSVGELVGAVAMALAVFELPDVAVALGVGDGSEDKGEVVLGLSHLFGGCLEALQKGSELGLAFLLGDGGSRSLGVCAFLLGEKFRFS